MALPFPYSQQDSHTHTGQTDAKVVYKKWVYWIMVSVKYYDLVFLI